MYDLKTIKELIKLMVTNDLTELDLQSEGERVALRRGPGESRVHYVTPPPAPVAAPAAGEGRPAAGAEPGASGEAAADAGTKPITSPMVGTFYAAASPDAKPYVAVGDRVEADKVVCIIEAMKVFNEIKAEVSGKIEKIMVQTGQAVEFGQPLFLVRPD